MRTPTPEASTAAWCKVQSSERCTAKASALMQPSWQQQAAAGSANAEQPSLKLLRQPLHRKGEKILNINGC